MRAAPPPRAAARLLATAPTSPARICDRSIGNAYARTGDLFLKVLEEEDRRTLTVCVDRTASMTTGEPERWCGALRLAAILSGLALVGLDGAEVVVAPDERARFEGAGALPQLLAWLEQRSVGPQDPTSLLRAALAGAGGNVCWLSDFAEPEVARTALRMVRRAGRRCSGWLPVVPDDRLPSGEGWTRLRDPETGIDETVLGRR